jgi:hypothetical protein
LMQCKNLWKCYNVLSSSITTTKIATTQWCFNGSYSGLVAAALCFSNLPD